MKNIDWRMKLSSRKFWMALGGFVTALCVVLKASPESTESIVGLVGAFGSLIAYILAEGYVDGNR